MLVGVGAVLVEDGGLLLVRRRNEPGKGLWAVPGGKVRVGETLVAAAEREVMEETGLQVAIGDVIWVGQHISEHGHIVLIDFAASVQSGTLLAGDDAMEAEWVPLQEAKMRPLTSTMYELVDLLLNGFAP